MSAEGFIIIIVFIIVVVLCIKVCCTRKSEGAIYSTPVVITSQTHQPLGASQPYQVAQRSGMVQSPYQPTVVVATQMTHNAPHYTMPNNAAPYPVAQQPMYPPQAAPYPSQVAPYPPQATPYPPQNLPHAQAAPYPSQSMQQPPTYNEVVNMNFEKQPAFNPTYGNTQ